MQVVDQIGNTVKAHQTKRRIVSLVPSLTELLCDLGLNNEIKGVTKFCVHPKEIKTTAEIIGGTKNLRIDKIHKLSPTLIVCNKEENNKEDIEHLRKTFQVYASDIANIEDAYKCITDLGKLLSKEIEASDIIFKIRNGFSSLQSAKSKITVAYLIWDDPIMTVGNDTFIHHILELCGFKNAFFRYSRYPEITPEDLKNAHPVVLLLSSEPYPFREKHFKKFRNILPQSTVHLADGEMFSWYGSRLIKAPYYLKELMSKLKM